MEPVANTALNFAQLRSVNVARCEEGFRHALKSWTPSQWLVAVGGEVGEALNVVKKITRVTDGLGQFRDTDVGQLKIKLGSELSDVVIYLDLLLARLDLQIAPAFIYSTFHEQSVSDLARLRQLDWDRMGYLSGLTDAAADVMDASGSLAREVIFDSVDRKTDDQPLFDGGIAVLAATAELLSNADVLATAAGIDLGAAIITTFNAKSIELGVSHRLGEVA